MFQAIIEKLIFEETNYPLIVAIAATVLSAIAMIHLLLERRSIDRASKFIEEKEHLEMLFDEIIRVEGHTPSFYYQVYIKELAILIQKYGNHECFKSKYEKYDAEYPQMSDDFFASAAYRARYRLAKKEIVAAWVQRRSSMNIAKWTNSLTDDIDALWKEYGIEGKDDEQRFFRPGMHTQI